MLQKAFLLFFMIILGKRVRSFIPHMSIYSKSTMRCITTTKNAMNAKNDMHGAKVIILTGPTAVGKSSVAKRICSIVDAEIIIADSVQVYKHLDIGANKPTKTYSSLRKPVVPCFSLRFFNLSLGFLWSLLL